MTSQQSGPAHLHPPLTSRVGRASCKDAFRFAQTFALLGAFLCLPGCDQLGLDTPAKAAERKLAEARAIGSACRHAMRAIEDCYVLNPKADKSAVFAGWREMDEYMRENKLEGVAPVVPRPAPAASKPPTTEDEEEPDEEASRAESGAKSAHASGH